jgi:hypothetical protein
MAKTGFSIGKTSVALSTAADAKIQPWKAFWPMKIEDYTAAEREKMPWLTWKYNPKNPTDKPWREWMLANQSTVVRRGRE